MSADPPVLKLAVRENWRFSDLENELTIVFSVGNFFSVILITVILHATFYNLNSKTYSLMFVRVVHFRACVLPPVSAAPAQCLHHSPSLGARPSGGSGGLNGRSTGPSGGPRGFMSLVHCVPIHSSRCRQLLMDFWLVRFPGFAGARLRCPSFAAPSANFASNVFASGAGFAGAGAVGSVGAFLMLPPFNVDAGVACVGAKGGTSLGFAGGGAAAAGSRSPDAVRERREREPCESCVPTADPLFGAAAGASAAASWSFASASSNSFRVSRRAPQPPQNLSPWKVW